ncbi:hypothetical protein AB7M45_002264 [Bradyrhizobium elkanii]|uniref:hypothetical protein n=1 Tax=Bradyrhizobium elkanii TaxID=29448 RepID=UPI0002DAC1FA|nr:hypothetical protein [Bradyrhizobium elkanii]MCW2189494.1 hypothetical protein [Bradyrhizobium elkanii]NWL74676.1 hypothetical protein [Bradyrhizobium elkanii]OIM95913.1 hypothetical protein BLN97_02865 [Bradyrhizobium elkanii]
MDMKEASAMTEASGLIDDQDAISAPQPSGQTESAGARRSLRQPPNEAALRWAEWLRKVTVQAPLSSLFVAFLLGTWVARRR